MDYNLFYEVDGRKGCYSLEDIFRLSKDFPEFSFELVVSCGAGGCYQHWMRSNSVAECRQLIKNGETVILSSENATILPHCHSISPYSPRVLTTNGVVKKYWFSFGPDVLEEDFFDEISEIALKRILGGTLPYIPLREKKNVQLYYSSS